MSSHRGSLPRRIGVTGSTYFRTEVGKIAFASDAWILTDLRIPNADDPAATWPAFCDQLQRQDLWYRIAGYFSAPTEDLCRQAHRLGVPMVIHWTGSDILAFREFVRQRPETLELARQFTHWATAPWLADELGALGIPAACVPFPIHKRLRYLDRPPPLLPGEFVVHTYIPDDQGDLYGWRHLERLAVDFPEIRINVVRGRGTRATQPPGNVRFLGWVEEIDDVYAGATVAVRMTRHDGLSGSIQEPLILGRHAIWTHPFPGALLAQDYTALHGHVARLLDLHRSGRLELNLEGRRYIEQHLHPVALARDLQQRILAILDRRQDQGARRGTHR